MNKKIGFIGAGNMAKAMMTGIIESGLISSENVMASAKTNKSIDSVKKEFNIKTTLNNKEVAKFADFLILAVKPYMYDDVMKEIKTSIKDGAIVIIIAAGISIDHMKKALGHNQIIVKTMPNTPASVREGITAVTFDDIINEDQKNEVISILESFGKIEEIDESLMGAFATISGSSPAYVFMMIEAMADAGVLQGIPRKQAYRMAAQAVLGAGKMVLETGLHPGELKDNVCSPKGGTIEAVVILEQKGFRSAMIEAMKISGEKAIEKEKKLANNKN